MILRLREKRESRGPSGCHLVGSCVERGNIRLPCRWGILSRSSDQFRVIMEICKASHG